MIRCYDFISLSRGVLQTLRNLYEGLTLSEWYCHISVLITPIRPAHAKLNYTAMIVAWLSWLWHSLSSFQIHVSLLSSWCIRKI